MIRLIRDLLDKPLQDRNGESAGRIDGIVLELRDGHPPIVRFVEVSPITLLGRFSARLAKWYARHDAKLGPKRGKPYRIPWGSITHAGPRVTMNANVEDTPINALEDWLRNHIVDRIPGS